MLSNSQTYFLFLLQRLADLLADHNRPAPMLYTILKEVRLASARWQGGEPFEDCYDFSLRRLVWRVEEAVASKSDLHSAVQILAYIVPLGMLLFRDIDACADPYGQPFVAGFVAALGRVGFDLRLHMKLPGAA